MTPAQSEFRATMARFATGVTVVTTALDGQYYGLTVNAFCSVSLEPCLVLISLDLTSQTYAVIRRSGIFAVNMLTLDQQDLAMRFARKDLQSKTFDDIPLHVGGIGAPLFNDALAYVECRVSAEYPGGDHALLLGDVRRVEVRDDGVAREPLIYYRSSFDALRRECVSIA